MANIESAKLDHELAEKFVLFKLNTKLRFEPEEVGQRWLLQIAFFEKDALKNDQLFLVPESVRVGEVHAGQLRNYIRPSKGEIDYSYDVEFPAHLVNTELGKEEVFAKVELKPVGEGVSFTPAEIETNITHVDV